MRPVRDRLTYANVISTLCLFLLLRRWHCRRLSGSNTVFSDDITNNEVYSADVRNDTLAGGGLAAADLRPGAVATSELASGAVSIPKLGFDPATQPELDAHKSSADHDGRYFTEDRALHLGWQRPEHGLELPPLERAQRGSRRLR